MKIWIYCTSVSLFLTHGVASASSACGEKERGDHPTLCHWLDRAEQDAQATADEIHAWAAARGLLVNFVVPDSPNPETIRMEMQHNSVTAAGRRHLVVADNNQEQLPVVLAHGMGDSCFNSGMQQLTAKVSEMLNGVYTVCIPIGSSQSEDTNNGYLLNMDASVDIFSEAARQDPNLAGGFHAIGLSQGSNVIRGYIAKVNTPPVHTFLAINGVNGGTGAVPYCRPEELEKNPSTSSSTSMTFSMCDLLMEQASKRAYTDFAQKHSFQANYWRDPRPGMFEMYQKYAQLAVWNNEAGFVNETFKENWAKTQAFVWVLATEDGMVFPAEGEQWCAPDPTNPFQSILPMKETAWYQDDLFGLRTADEAGKNNFESFEGDHLRFEMEDFEKVSTRSHLLPQQTK
jgi:palmitoyl-protein thioesterase